MVSRFWGGCGFDEVVCEGRAKGKGLHWLLILGQRGSIVKT